LIPSDFIEVFDMVVDSYSVRIPTYVRVSKKNQQSVNLNVYRNLHHHHLNAQKKNFTDEVTPLLEDKPRAEKIWIHYTIFAPSNRRLDTMNVGSITDKYFSDTMVEAGKIPDDNQEHIVLSTFSFGGVVPIDGHAIATVYILQKETKDMRILLDQDDIQNALNAYVKTLQFPNADKAEVDLSIEDGEIVAEVIIGEAPVKNRGGRPRKIRAMNIRQTEVTEDAAETDSEGSSDSTDSGSSDASETDTEAGEETVSAERIISAERETPKGNLFRDEESQSSDSTAEAEDSPTSKPKTLVKPGKKSSIFDVD
jgi:hypothetical protein